MQLLTIKEEAGSGSRGPSSTEINFRPQSVGTLSNNDNAPAQLDTSPKSTHLTLNLMEKLVLSDQPGREESSLEESGEIS